MLDYDDDEGEEDEYYDDSSAGGKGENRPSTRKPNKTAIAAVSATIFHYYSISNYP